MRVLGLAMMLLAVSRLGAAQAPVFDQAIRASAALELVARQTQSVAPLSPALTGASWAEQTSHSRKGTGKTLMIIGGSALLVGAIAGGGGGAVLIVGGFLCAGYGFYLYSE